MIEDKHYRVARNLCLSVTSACSMRGHDCRPDRGAVPPRDELTAGEIEELVGYLVQAHGLEKVRLTGGEPTARPDLLAIIRRLGRLEGLQDISLTTSGLTLSCQAVAMKRAGLHGVNVSLNTLDRERYRRITGVDGLAEVLQGIEAARDAGLRPVKINTVIVRGENDDELPALLDFAARCGLTIRFIELTPKGPLAHRWKERFVPAPEMRRRLRGHVRDWYPFVATGTATRLYAVRLRNGMHATLGLISAMSCTFGQQCGRLRIASDGTLYPCPMGPPSGNLLASLRPRLEKEILDTCLMQACLSKAIPHPYRAGTIMTGIGG